MRYFMLFLLWSIVVFHVFVILGVITSFFVLPLTQPLCVALPLMIYIVSLLTTRVECQLTNIENVIRKRVGMKRIGAFVGHYCVRPVRKMLMQKKVIDEN